MMKQSSSSTVHKECIGGKLICDWILENRPNCQTLPIPLLLTQLIAHTLPIRDSAITRLGSLVCFFERVLPTTQIHD